MRLTRIRLTDFKRHKQLEIEPAAGLTIIRGPNEAGKSTIQKALELVLFRKADANRDDIRKAHAWGSVSPPEVVLDFEADGHSGRLSKRFDGARSEAELTLDGDSIRDYTLIGDRIAEITGIPTEAFFRATASIGHAELGAVGGDEPMIQDRLQKAISGADRGTAKAKKKLETAIRRYRTEGHKNPGLLKVLREEMAMLEGELANGEAALERLEADRAQWVEAHERRGDLDVQLTLQAADLAEARRAEALATQRDQAQHRYDRLKRAAELVEEGDRLHREMPIAMPLPQLRSAVAQARDLELELSELEADLDAEAATDAAADDEPELKPPRPVRWLLIAIALLAIAGIAWFALGGIIGAVVALLLSVATFVALVQSVRLATRRRQYGLALQLAEHATAERHDADRERQDRFRRKRRELDAVCGDLGVSDVTAAESHLATAEGNTEELLRIDGELRGLGVEERNIRRLEEARDQAANATEQARHAMAGMGALAEDPLASRQAAQKLVERTTPARDKARSEEDQAQGRVDANPVDAEIVAGLSERLSAARERYAELERRVLVYGGTLESIERAEQATLKTAARYLEERMGPTISRVTDGRYDEIEVDEKNLAFTVRAPESGDLVSVDQLSRGTADQLYLAARLGLVRLVTMDRRPPLILDDPFVTFDRPRGERALRLVKQLAAEQGFQVLYLTCSDRFDALADKLVVLEGPSSDRVLAAPAKPPDKATTANHSSTAVAPEPKLHFEPDPRPNPDPLAPHHSEAESAGHIDPDRGTDSDSDTDPDPDTGVIDPFRMADRDGSERAD